MKDGQAYRGYTAMGTVFALWNQKTHCFSVLHAEGAVVELRDLLHQDDPKRTADEIGFSPLQMVADDECALAWGRAAMSAIYYRRVEQK